MNYNLSDLSEDKVNVAESLKKLLPLLSGQYSRISIAFVGILINSGLTIWAPLLVGQAIDQHLVKGDYNGIIVYAFVLFAIFIGMFFSGIVQTRVMGGVGQQLLFRLRGALFDKIQLLPVAFFNQNKAGDLISRINNDTDKLNQFFSRSLIQFVGNVFIIIGAGMAMLVVNAQLGTAALLPAVGLLVITRFTSSWIKRKNTASLQSLGGLSAEVQESLDNFRVIVAFNRRDYFRERFTQANNANYKAAIAAGIANITYVPIFGLVSNLGTLIVVAYGLQLISQGQLSVGILISYLAYVNRFYDPLRQMASIWSDFQTAMAAWERISQILHMESNLPVIPAKKRKETRKLLEFKDVSFRYQGSKDVLTHVTFALEKHKTYALVGPTGGGKSTTASLMARLYDPTEGIIVFDGQDLKSYTPQERAHKIGFILQDPFLFSGTLHDNITYGSPEYAKLSGTELTAVLAKEGLGDLLSRFEDGLDTVVDGNTTSITLGQKQLIAFMRAVLRHPDLLILDEATANIDTVTEQLLDKALQQLPGKTTVVIIAHRLNTIANADQILFVNAGTITSAGSLDHAVEMLEKNARKS